MNNFDVAEIFMDAVNFKLQLIELEDEFIDLEMAEKYIALDYSVDGAVADICETLEMIMQ